MDTPKSLAPRLAYCRIQPGNWDVAYDWLIARLGRSGATDGAPKPGDVMPDFVLPDASGSLRRLGDLVADGPVVLSFNRGSWCPYCSVEIAAWAGERDRLARAGGRLIILTPETGGRMQALADSAGAGAVVLCDVDLGVALRNGLAFPVGPEILGDYLSDGFDLGEVNGTANGFLPVPATFVLDSARRVRFAFVDPDFSHRAEPADVLAVLEGLATGG